MWLLWPNEHWHFEIEAAVFLAGSVIGWIYCEFTGVGADTQVKPREVGKLPERPHPHDVKLYERFNERLPVSDRAFLRGHHFRTPLDARRLDGLEEVADTWNGADFEFYDDGLRTAFRRFRHRADELLGLTGESLYTDERNACVLTPLTDIDRRRGITQDTVSRINSMNAKLREVVQEMDVFLRLAQERIEQHSFEEHGPVPNAA